MNVQPWVALALMFLLVPDPNPRKTAGGTDEQEQASAKPDSARLGLRGPIKTCLEENTAPDGHAYSTYQEFSPEGKTLEWRFHNPDGSEWITKSTYDADGRLIRIVSAKPGEPPAQTLYAYDEAGRLMSITNSDSKNRTDYRYDEQGRKTEVTTFDPKMLQRDKDTAFSGSGWQAALAGFGVPAGGRVLTVYDENDRATELQIRDAEDHLVSRVVRTYNAAGLVTEEKPTVENHASLLDQIPAEMRSKLDDDTRRTMTALLQGQRERTTLFEYDAQGRVTTKRETGIFESVITTSYNEQGDMADERTIITSPLPLGTSSAAGDNSTIAPSGFIGPASHMVDDSDVHYTYQYDQYGNWTQQTTTDAKHPETPPSVRRRTLTYY